MKVTVAIPCYKSSKTISIVVDQITSKFRELNRYDYEIILINDCSPDNTFEIIKELCQKDSHIMGIDLSRNWGQAAARMACLKQIDSDCLIYMDDDGQHPIEYLPQLIQKIEEGYDLVSADFSVKQTKKINKLTSAISSKLFQITGKRPKGAVSSSYFAINRMCIESLKKYQSPFPSIFGYLYQIAGKITSIKVKQNKRIVGKSGYNFSKRFKVWLNGMINFSIFPLRLSSFLGVIFSITGFIFGIVLFIRKLLFPNILVGYTSVITIILFIGGLIMIMLGLIGEYIGRIYLTISNQPQFEIREIIKKEGEM